MKGTFMSALMSISLKSRDLNLKFSRQLSVVCFILFSAMMLNKHYHLELLQGEDILVMYGVPSLVTEHQESSYTC